MSRCPGLQRVRLIPRCRWSAIFLWVYTDQITFASLSSQAITPSKEVQDGFSQGEVKYPQDSEGLGAPDPGAVVAEPCSPKSVYCLANKVYLAPLLSDRCCQSLFRLGRLEWTL